MLTRKILFRYLCVISLLSVLSACNSKNVNDSTRKGIELVFEGEVKTADISDYMEAMTPFCIETSDNALLKHIGRVVEGDNCYYILDGSGRMILCIDLTGKVNFVISEVGTGPLEYKQISDIAWDAESKQLVILALNKLLFANKEGKIIESKDMPSYYRYITTNSSDLVISNSTYVNKELSNFQLTIIENDGTVLETLKPLHEYAPFCTVNGPELTTAGEKVYFTRKFDPNIYEVDKEAIPAYTIDWGTSLFKPEEGKEYDCMELSEICSDANQVYALTDLQQGKNFISFRTNLRGVNIASKADLKIVRINVFLDSNLKLSLPNYTPVEGNSGIVFFQMPAPVFLAMTANTESETLKALAANITPESNPVIFPYILK